MKYTISGYPSLGENQELLKAESAYWKHEIDAETFKAQIEALKLKQIREEKEAGLDWIPADFTLFDAMADMAWMLHIVPQAAEELPLSELDKYFAFCRGLQEGGLDIPAAPMRYWPDWQSCTVVPVLDDTVNLHLRGDAFLNDYRLYRDKAGVETSPVLIGPYTFLRWAKYPGSKKAENFQQDIIKAYQDMLSFADDNQVAWMTFVEPAWALERIDEEDLVLLRQLYEGLLPAKKNVKVALQIPAGCPDPRVLDVLNELDLAGLELDLAHSNENLVWLETAPWPEERVLFAGLASGREIWKTDYAFAWQVLESLKVKIPELVVSTSCSLRFLPYTVRWETPLPRAIWRQLAFAREKLAETAEIARLRELPEEEREHIIRARRRLVRHRPKPAGFSPELVDETLDMLDERGLMRSIDQLLYRPLPETGPYDWSSEGVRGVENVYATREAWVLVQGGKAAHPLIVWAPMRWKKGSFQFLTEVGRERFVSQFRYLYGPAGVSTFNVQVQVARLMLLRMRL